MRTSKIEETAFYGHGKPICDWNISECLAYIEAKDMLPMNLLKTNRLSKRMTKSLKLDGLRGYCQLISNGLVADGLTIPEIENMIAQSACTVPQPIQITTTNNNNAPQEIPTMNTQQPNQLDYASIIETVTKTVMAALQPPQNVAQAVAPQPVRSIDMAEKLSGNEMPQFQPNQLSATIQAIPSNPNRENVPTIAFDAPATVYGNKSVNLPQEGSDWRKAVDSFIGAGFVPIVCGCRTTSGRISSYTILFNPATPLKLYTVFPKLNTETGYIVWSPNERDAGETINAYLKGKAAPAPACIPDIKNRLKACGFALN